MYTFLEGNIYGSFPKTLSLRYMRTVICVNLNEIQTHQFWAGCLHFRVLVTSYVSVTTPLERRWRLERMNPNRTSHKRSGLTVESKKLHFSAKIRYAVSANTHKTVVVSWRKCLYLTVVIMLSRTLYFIIQMTVLKFYIPLCSRMIGKKRRTVNTNIVWYILL